VTARAIAIVVVFAVALALAGPGERADQPEAPAAGPGLAMLALDPANEDQLLAETGSPYDYVIVRDVRPETRQALAAFQQANPETEVLLYTNAGFMFHDESDPAACEYWPFNGDGADFCDASERHDDWFLHDASGNRLRSSGYPSSWAANIGNPGYQENWVNSVLARLEGDLPAGSGVRVDGVYLDDLNLNPGHGLDGRIAEYDDPAYRQAAIAFGSSVASRMREAGFATMANAGIDVHDEADRAGVLELAEAGVIIHREQFVRYVDTPVFTTPAADRGNDWLTELELFERVQAAGDGYVALVYGRGDEAEVARYARATFLLGWDGESPSALTFRTEDGSDPLATPEWQTQIGLPVDERSQVGDRQAWRRHYSDGIVIVNADPYASQVFELGADYLSPEGDCVAEVELAAAAGAVMPRCGS
jgi:hypothetical protein